MRHAACLPARMGGGGKTGIDALARASGHSPPHGGVYSGLGNERAKPLVFLLNQTIAPVRRSARRAADHRERCPRTARRRRVTCRQAECATRLLREAQRRRRSERARGAHSASREARAPAGQHQDTAPSGARSAGQSASLNLPAQSSPLPIVTRMGRDYRPGPRQRIERVARRAARSEFLKYTTENLGLCPRTLPEQSIAVVSSPAETRRPLWDRVTAVLSSPLEVHAYLVSHEPTTSLTPRRDYTARVEPLDQLTIFI